MLFSDLDGEAAGQVVDRLEADDVAYQLADGGRSVLVPAGSHRRAASRLRRSRACRRRGRIGFEIFDTHAVRHDRVPRAGELPSRASRASWLAPLRRIVEVQAARVHIAMAKESPVRRTRAAGQGVGRAEAQGHQGRWPPPAAAASPNLVAASVEGLRPESVVIIDTFGSLARPDGRRGRTTVRWLAWTSSASSGTSATWP